VFIVGFFLWNGIVEADERRNMHEWSLLILQCLEQCLAHLQNEGINSECHGLRYNRRNFIEQIILDNILW
jgi:hypothetical protein